MTNGGDSMICAGLNCRHKNAPTARYCARCGKALSFLNQGQLQHCAGMQHNPYYLERQAAGMQAMPQRILLDDTREDTHGCSLAAWDWYRGVTLLGWIVVACLSWWLAAKLGWELGGWFRSWV